MKLINSLKIKVRNTLCCSFTLHNKKIKKLCDSELNMYPFFLLDFVQKLVQVRQKSKEIPNTKSTYSTKKSIFFLISPAGKMPFLLPPVAPLLPAAGRKVKCLL